MKLLEYMEGTSKESPIKMLGIVHKLIELQAIEQYLNVMFGIELDIEVKPVEIKEGRWYGKSIIKKLSKEI